MVQYGKPSFWVFLIILETLGGFLLGFFFTMSNKLLLCMWYLPAQPCPRVTEAGRGLWRSSTQIPRAKQGHLEQAAQDLSGLAYLQT